MESAIVDARTPHMIVFFFINFAPKLSALFLYYKNAIVQAEQEKQAPPAESLLDVNEQGVAKFDKVMRSANAFFKKSIYYYIATKII